MQYPFNTCPWVATRAHIQLCCVTNGGYAVPCAKIQMATGGHSGISGLKEILQEKILKKLVIFLRLKIISEHDTLCYYNAMKT